jgi:hypothetical protein
MSLFRKREACKECGELQFTVISVITNKADIRKGRLDYVMPNDKRKSVAVSVVCDYCGRLHEASEFRLAA